MSYNDWLARDGTRTRPAAICFPSSDKEFQSHVRSVLASLTEAPAPVTAERLAIEIAELYPNVIVREKNELAGFGSGTVFYAYRDRDGVGPAPITAPQDGRASTAAPRPE